MSNLKSYETKSTQIACVAAVLCVVTAGISSAGITRGGVSFGRITQFASIFVNDRKFDIDTATITIDGQSASAAELKLGQTVFVDGIVDDELPVGIADEVTVITTLQGGISEVDIDADQLTVLGSTVFTNPDTVIEHLSGGVALEDFAVGDRVAISGFTSSGGDVVASRIEHVADGSGVLVTGTATDPSVTTLDVHDLTIQFGNAELLGFSFGVPIEGDNVRALGSSFATNGDLIANRLEFVPRFTGGESDKGEIEGPLSGFESPADFQVGQLRVTTDEHTQFVGGGPANLTLDTEVVVRGEFDASGALQASSVEIRGTQIRVYGLVDFASSSSLTALGVSLLATAATEVKDSSKAKVEPFAVSNLSPGDYVEVRSAKNPPNATPVIAARIERDDAEESARLQGFAGSISGQSFDVFGVTIYVDSDTEYADADDDEISQQAFFTAITPGTFVQVRGTSPAAQVVVATDISLQLHD